MSIGEVAELTVLEIDLEDFKGIICEPWTNYSLAHTPFLW